MTTMIPWMMAKIKDFVVVIFENAVCKNFSRISSGIFAVSVFSAVVLGSLSVEAAPTGSKTPATAEKISVDTKDPWELPPVETSKVTLQILDKISGKVFREKLDANQTVEVGTIRLTLERAFLNNPEDFDEVCALIKIEENDKVIFRNWLFASAPSVNFFEHPVYDVRLEVQK